jgi:D-alanyl-D-alanine dipeptidase
LSVKDTCAQLKVTTSYNDYRRQVAKDGKKQMVELKSLVPSIHYDLKYATTDNFTGQRLYRQDKLTFLRSPAADALKKVQEQLAGQGLGLKIFDAYRPWSTTKKMWDLVKDERYVANPEKGSNHNRGLAVDLTIIELSTGKELDMGTGFDNFTDTSHHDFRKLPPQVLNNRKLLKGIMEQNGFRLFETEWWHYSWPNDRDYEVLDIDFNKFRKRRL